MADLEGYAIGALDGAIGHVRDFYFDDVAWIIRYLVVETGAWPSSRKVLISPTALGNADWPARLLPVSLTKRQVLHSPGIDTDRRLRGCKALMTYYVQAKDGEIGHVQGLLVDEDSWTIRYMVVDTSNWWIGQKVLISPQWIGHMGWADARVSVDLDRDAVKHAPPYKPGSPMERDDEAGVYRHYGRPGYWGDEDDRRRRLHR